MLSTFDLSTRGLPLAVLGNHLLIEHIYGQAVELLIFRIGFLEFGFSYVQRGLAYMISQMKVFCPVYQRLERIEIGDIPFFSIAIATLTE